MVFDQVRYGMDAAMYRTAKVVFIAKVLSARPFLIFSDMDRMAVQFIHSLVFSG